MPKRRMPFPSIKTTLSFVVVVFYTVILTLVFVSVIDHQSSIHIPSIGNMIVIGYEAHGGDILTAGGNQTLNWGTVLVGTSTNRSFILRSKSNTITKPQLNTTAWTFKNKQNQTVAPPTVNNITVNWTLNNTLLMPNEEVNVTLILAVKSDAAFVDYLIDNYIETFSFDIIIQPSQV